MMPSLAGQPGITAATNPVLDEIDRAHATLSPPAQQALERAHGIAPPPAPAPITDGIKPPPMGGLPNIAAPENTPPAPIGIPGMPRGGQGTMQDATADVSKIAPPSAHQMELARLTGAGPNPSEGKSGIAQIHNPWLRGLATVGDVIGTGFFPRAAAAIPGTSLHHQVLVNAATGAEKQDETERNDAQKRDLEAAQAANQNSLPELHQTQAELAARKESEVETGHRNTEDINRAKNEGVQATAAGTRKATLASHGFKEDEHGAIVPLGYDEMSETQQAVHDLKAAQVEQAEATAALRKAQAANQPQVAAMAQKRLENSQTLHAIASRRLGLSEKQFEMRAHGTEGGQALPGSIITDEGTPVGTGFQQNVRPTGTERSRADLALSAQEQLQDMRSIVKKHPEFFGPGAGRKSEFTVWLGSEDPEAKRFQTARSILADHAAGVFGARSEYASKAQEIASGQFKDNPDAILTGLEQIEKAMGTIKGRGEMRTTGSDVAKKKDAGATPSDPAVKAYADKFFSGDLKKAQEAIDQQKKK